MARRPCGAAWWWLAACLLACPVNCSLLSSSVLQSCTQGVAQGQSAVSLKCVAGAQAVLPACGTWATH